MFFTWRVYLLVDHRVPEDTCRQGALLFTLVDMKCCGWLRRSALLRAYSKISVSILLKFLIVVYSAPFHLSFGILSFRINIRHFIKAFFDQYYGAY